MKSWAVESPPSLTGLAVIWKLLLQFLQVSPVKQGNKCLKPWTSQRSSCSTTELTWKGCCNAVYCYHQCYGNNLGIVHLQHNNSSLSFMGIYRGMSCPSWQRSWWITDHFASLRESPAGVAGASLCSCTYASEPQRRVRDFCVSLSDLSELRQALNFPSRAGNL